MFFVSSFGKDGPSQRIVSEFSNPFNVSSNIFKFGITKNYGFSKVLTPFVV